MEKKKEVDQEPCACLVKAALISGFDVSKLLHERESTATWKRQYVGLPQTQYDLPSTEEINACPADKLLVAASSYPTPSGRPSTNRLKGAIDFWKKKAKRARINPALLPDKLDLCGIKSPPHN